MLIQTILESLTHFSLLTRFALALAVCLFVPQLSARVRLPAAVGLLLAGMVFGPYGLAIVPQEPVVADFFAEVGKLLLMFFAGLEIDIDQFSRVRNRSLLFGILTCGLPTVVGIVIGLFFGYGWVGAVLIGSLLASHTLLGFPIVQRLGLTDSEPVTVTVGATIFTDLVSLLILAVCLPIHTAGFSLTGFLVQIAALAIYVPVVLIGLSTLAKKFLHKRGDSTANEFLMILLIMVLAAEGAALIHLEAIIGAFLAGLAVNRVIKHSEAKEQLEFLANTLFIPVFFITIGFLIDVRVFFATIFSNLGLVVGIVGGLIAAKFAAATTVRRIFGYTSLDGLLMGALSLPQVAATLAAALVAFEAKNAAGDRLIDERMVNTVIVLMVVTSVLGPILTEVFGTKLAMPNVEAAPQDQAVPTSEAAT